jgi:urate oxidase
MAIRLGENNYGKQRVRLLRLSRQEGRHDIKELTLGIRLEGDFETAHTASDNSKILPTDTMKNTVYALARKHVIASSEKFCLQLADHFLTRNPQVSKVIVEASETLWQRLPFGGKPHPYTFTQAGGQKHTAIITATNDGKTVQAGIEGLAVLKTTQSAFEGFLKDDYTTLKEDRNRILSTLIHATWTYRNEEVEFAAVWHAIRQILLDTFAEHDSQSLQHTLYAMGEAVLNNFDSVTEIHLSLPNKHYNLVNLTPFQMDNPGEVFLPTDEPHGLIEATLRKGWM